jgi:hypothetical protein
VIGLVESQVVLCVNREVGGVDIVPLHYPLKDLRLVHGPFLHKVDYFILDCDSMIYIVV